MLTNHTIESLASKVSTTTYAQDLAAQPGPSQYFKQAVQTLVVWEHLITLSDEIEYVWKREKSWRESCGVSS